MTAITLTSSGEHPLRPLIEAALGNELRILLAGIKQTTDRLRTFEAQFGMTSDEFIKRYESDELPETLDFVEWVGEVRLLERLSEKAETLREIRIEN